MPSLYIIDAHAYLHRAYHALPSMNNSRGEPVNAVYGFLRMISKILRQYKPDYVAVCFDTAAPAPSATRCIPNTKGPAKKLTRS